MLRSEFCSLRVSRSALMMVLLVCLVPGCKKRASVAVPIVVNEPEKDPSRASRAPDLEAFLTVDKVPEGTVWLVWKADNADSVVIDNGIGGVVLQGRIQLPPAARTTYTVTAYGPGGLTSREVRVDSGVPGQPDSRVSEQEVRSPEKQFSLQVKPVYFELNSQLLCDEAYSVLDASIAWLTKPENHSIHFTVEGYSDPAGSEEFGHALGDIRAALVRSYMLERGVDEGRILAVSLGEEGSADEQKQGYPAKSGRAVFVLSR